MGVTCIGVQPLAAPVCHWGFTPRCDSHQPMCRLLPEAVILAIFWFVICKQRASDGKQCICEMSTLPETGEEKKNKQKRLFCLFFMFYWFPFIFWKQFLYIVINSVSSQSFCEVQTANRSKVPLFSALFQTHLWCLLHSRLWSWVYAGLAWECVWAVVIPLSWWLILQTLWSNFLFLLI